MARKSPLNRLSSTSRRFISSRSRCCSSSARSARASAFVRSSTCSSSPSYMCASSSAMRSKPARHVARLGRRALLPQANRQIAPPHRRHGGAHASERLGDQHRERDVGGAASEACQQSIAENTTFETVVVSRVGGRARPRWGWRGSASLVQIPFREAFLGRSRTRRSRRQGFHGTRGSSSPSAWARSSETPARFPFGPPDSTLRARNPRKRRRGRPTRTGRACRHGYAASRSRNASRTRSSSRKASRCCVLRWSIEAP